MRTLYFLLPGTGGKFACGGLWAELRTLDLMRTLCPAQVVTYRQREPDTLFLDDILRQPPDPNVIFVMSWGFDVPKLARRLRGRACIYHAHSAEYGFRLPAAIPIITVSRQTMGYWGQRSPHALIYYLPNQIAPEFCDRNSDRDVDILVQARKSSTYLMQTLIPALQQRYRVTIVDRYVDDLVGLFNRAKVYLYDSAEYWAERGVTEGFGLQPLEAMACGCHVFSSVNGGLADYLDPGFNAHKIGAYTLEYDLLRIDHVLTQPKFELAPQVLTEYHRDSIVPRCDRILAELNAFFDHTLNQPNATHIPPLTPLKMYQKRWQRLWTKLTQLRQKLS